MAWNNYKSHKIVRATLITMMGPKSAGTPPVLVVEGDNGTEPFVPSVAEMADKASVGDYAVVYEDGYRSVSPRAAFENGYTAVES